MANIFCTIPTIENLRGGSFCSHLNLYMGKAVKDTSIAAPLTRSFTKPQQQLPPITAAWAITFSAIDLITDALIWLLTLSNFQYSPLLFESFFCLWLFSFVDCLSAEFRSSSTVEAKRQGQQGAGGRA